jgi:superfamily II DNA/RNA helicase
MLDMGFIPDIERIAKLLPFTRQTLFFSATMPPEIQRLADNFLSNPIRIEASKPATAAATVSQRIVTTGKEPAEKRAVLRALIRGAADFKNAIIFCNRKRDVATLQRSLARHGFNAGALHGDMDQRSRTQTLDDFRKDKLTLLVASDVAARGLDIPAVSHVFNFDVPTHAEDYIHRIGRTGRAGLTGTAITIAAPIDRKYVGAIEKMTGQPIQPLEVEASAERAASVYGNREPQSEAPETGNHRRDRHRGPRRERSQRAESGAPSNENQRAQEDRNPAPARPTPISQSQPEGRTADRGDRNDNQRRDRHEPRRDAERRDRRRQDREDSEPSPLGLGDHVPQFLLRRTRVPVSES